MTPFQADFFDTSPSTAARLSAKRALDLVTAAVALLPALPLMGVIAVAVKRSSPGPVLFRQVRIGQHGRPFVMLKFRTMRDGTHQQVLAQEDLSAYARRSFKLPANDPRITKVGRLLRKSSLDELPQLWNVLRGDMSMVGVRPVEPLEFQYRCWEDQLVYTRLKPGITGLWQVKGRSTNDYQRRLQLEREYVEGWSVLGDLLLLARTPLAVLRVHHAH